MTSDKSKLTRRTKPYCLTCPALIVRNNMATYRLLDYLIAIIGSMPLSKVAAWLASNAFVVYLKAADFSEEKNSYIFSDWLPQKPSWGVMDGKRYIFYIEFQKGAPADNDDSKYIDFGHPRSNKKCQEDRRRRGDRECWCFDDLPLDYVACGLCIWYCSS